MEIYSDLVDWEKLSELGGEAFQEAAAEGEAEFDWMMSGYELGLEIDSAIVHQALAESLTGCLPTLSEEIRDKVERSVIPLSQDVLEVNDIGFSDGYCFHFLAASPSTVQRMKQDFSSLDLQELVSMAEKHKTDEEVTSEDLLSLL